MTRNKSYELILTALLHDSLLFQEIMLRITREIFDINEYNVFVEYLRNFFKENKRLPSLPEFQLFCGPLVYGQFQAFASEVFTSPVVVDRDFARRAFYKNYQVVQMLSFLDRSETQIEQDTLNLQQEMHVFRDMVRDTTEGVRNYTEWRTEEDFIKSYKRARDFRLGSLSKLAFKTFNRVVGGQAKRETLIYIAPPNRGKTLYLVNELFHSLMQGEKTLYLSMENQVDESVTCRLTDRILLMPRAEQRLREDMCIKFLTRFKRYIKTPVLMYRPANRFSIEELDMWIEEYEMQSGEVFDTIIVDYLNKFAKKKVSKTSAQHEDERLLADDLREIGVRRDKRIISAAQTNRSGLVNREGKKTETTTEDMIQGGFGQYETVDLVLGFSETPNEKQQGVGRVSILKARDEGGRGKEFLVTVAPWVGLITDDAETLVPDKESLKDPKAVFDDLPGLKTISEPTVGQEKKRREPEVKKIKDVGMSMIKTDGIEI